MGEEIVLYGASGHCKVIIDILQKSNFDTICVIDDNPKKESILGLKIMNANEFDFSNCDKMILSIGDNEIRKRISDKLKYIQFATALDSKAIISSFSKIEEGTVVMPGAIINADVLIGKHVIINSSAVVEHDCVVSNYAHISPNASLAGGVVVGEGSHVGIGACVIQNVKIGKWATIGAGAVVIKDVPDYAVVVGNPANIIKIKVNE